MTEQTTRPTPPSPLDPFLEPFLQALADRAGGYAPTAHGAALAHSLGWPPAFAEAVFVSARSRGFLEPCRDRAARGRARWALSERGRAWLTRSAPGPDPMPRDDATPAGAEASLVPRDG